MTYKPVAVTFLTKYLLQIKIIRIQKHTGPKQLLYAVYVSLLLLGGFGSLQSNYGEILSNHSDSLCQHQQTIHITQNEKVRNILHFKHAVQ